MTTTITPPSQLSARDADEALQACEVLKQHRRDIRRGLEVMETLAAETEAAARQHVRRYPWLHTELFPGQTQASAGQERSEPPTKPT